jgi:hypothetical protein
MPQHCGLLESGRSIAQGGTDVTSHRRIVMIVLALIIGAGMWSAIHNLPVLTGCEFYGECPQSQVDTVTPHVAPE